MMELDILINTAKLLGLKVLSHPNHFEIKGLYRASPLGSIWVDKTTGEGLNILQYHLFRVYKVNINMWGINGQERTSAENS